MSKKTDTLDLTTCDIKKGLIRFSLPFLGAFLLQSLYSTVDTIIVGQFAGSAGLAAVNNTTYICNAACNIGMGASVGSTVLIAQYCGAKNEAGIHRTIGTALSISAIMAVILSVLVCSFANPLLNLMDIPPEARQEAYNYLIVRSVCFITCFLYSSITSFLRGMGDSKRPLYFSAVACVTNVVLDLLFVAVFEWGAGGAALATEISQAFALVWAFLYLRKNQPGLVTLKPSQYKIHGPTAKTVLKIGIPSSCQYVFIDLSFIFVNSIINGFGLIAASAVAVGGKIINLGQVVVTALATGIGTMAGQNIGAGQQDRAAKCVKIGFWYSLIVGVIVFVIIQLFPEQLVRLFNSDPEAMAESARCLRIYSLMMFTGAVFFTHISIAQAVGATGFAMFTYILDGVVVRISLSLLLTRVFDLGLVGIYFGLGLAPLLSGIIAVIYFYSGVWRKKKLLEDSALNAG